MSAPSLPSKTQLRAEIKATRDAFRSALSSAVLSLTFSKAPSPLAALFLPGKTLASYIALGSEADPAKLTREAEKAGCNLALPFVTSKAQPMRFLAWQTDQPLTTGPFSLMQPAASSPEITPDIVLVPLVGFDRNCNRIGQGAGHYDRALSLLPDALRIGIAWSIQEVSPIPTDPWDEPLHAICTEKEWILP